MEDKQNYYPVILLLPNIRMLTLSLKNLGKDQDLPVFIQTLASK